MKFLYITVMTIFLANCGYQNTQLPADANNNDPGINNANGNGNGTTNGVDFASVKSNVFVVYCLRCHSQAGGNKGGINLESYAGVRASLSLISNAVNSGMMPPSGALPAVKINILNTWIQMGAPEFQVNNPNNGGAPTVPVPTPDPNNPPSQPPNCPDDRINSGNDLLNANEQINPSRHGHDGC